ncbi:MAG TPA: nickel pincer cofactor biosynthesis protein LarC [Dermatophilaceae bacterium]|nr:nickel pincer cofactor biosynthesis protein LarC [Dermatophilaceae bacterium]
MASSPEHARLETDLLGGLETDPPGGPETETRAGLESQARAGLESQPEARLHAWLDVSAGVAGDMLLGALLDAGAPLGEVQAAIDAVLPDTVRVSTASVTRAGLRATHARIEPLVSDHPHRLWTQVRELLLGAAALAEPVRAQALDVFERLAEAEARVHGMTAGEVHFHEVGAWDSIADVVGVCAAVPLLGVDSVSAGPVALGSGRSGTAHGELAVPVPGALELARGWEAGSGGAGELATPTGLALVRSLADVCEPLPLMRVAGVGVGAGTRDSPDRANVVRVVLGHVSDPPPSERLWVLEANVDDLDPRVWPDVLSRLVDAGAADAWLTPILMKKGRPAHTLSVLSDDGHRSIVRDLALSLTTSFGIREYAVNRLALERDWRSVPVRGAAVRVKVSLGPDRRIRHVTPEFDDAAGVAAERGVPVRIVLGEASAAAAAAGIRPGVVLDRNRADHRNET